jgi:two-component system sensor histidine kinase HydH
MDDLEAKLQMLAAECELLASKGVRAAPRMARLVEEIQAELQQLIRQRRELASLYEVSQALAGATDLGELLNLMIDKALALVGAERGFVVLAGPAGEVYTAARRFGQGEVEGNDQAFSSSLVKRVMERREPILTTNIQEDGRFELSQSILLQNIRSVLAVPLLAHGELQGAIYVDTRLSVRPFNEADLRLLQAMATQAALIIHNAKLYAHMRESNRQLEQALQDLRQAQDQLVQAERLAAVGRLAASVAHELRNPLMVMGNSIYFLERLVDEGKWDSPDVFKRYLGKLNAEIERQTKIINDLLFFSRSRPRQLAEVDLHKILNDTLARLPMAETITVRREFAPQLNPVRADADQVQQVFINLISNAIQAMPRGGTLTIKTWPEEYFAAVEVSDTGVGISPENLSRVFEPFFTTKEKGMGLGLSVTKSLVEGHRGKIEVASTVGQGTTFTVRLPFELVG